MVGINMNMSALKNAIFNEVKIKHESAGKLDNLQLNKLMFYHTDGMRLTFSGFVIIKAIFTAYSFGLPVDVKSRHRAAMSKIEYPYFFTPTRLILFSEMDATVIKLAGGVLPFLETCSQINRYE